jgi:hypothetical protein
MSLLAALALTAALATVISLVLGITSMATAHEVNHHTSVEWMDWRVIFQSVALLCIVIALATKALA